MATQLGLPPHYLGYTTDNPASADAIRSSEAQLEPLDVRLEQAAKKAEAVAQKLVADQGRGTVREAVRRDRQ
ncbi:hypothetical protein KBZ21_41550, partial [Streptomyces sp. A73]|nr:hypothetical protein [Streptomyces sp. A73]